MKPSPLPRSAEITPSVAYMTSIPSVKMRRWSRRFDFFSMGVTPMKASVSGMIGNRHGVSDVNRPAMNAIMRANKTPYCRTDATSFFFRADVSLWKK